MAVVICGPSATGKSRLLEKLELDRKQHDFDVYCADQKLTRNVETFREWADSHSPSEPIVLSNDLKLVSDLIELKADIHHTFVYLEKPTRELLQNMILTNTDGQRHPVSGISSVGIESAKSLYRRLADLSFQLSNENMHLFVRVLKNLCQQPYLNRWEFMEMCEVINSGHKDLGHWNKYRWTYHARCLEILANIEGQSFLEIGTMGIKLHKRSVSMDYSLQNHWPLFQPDFVHDARITPWPFKDKNFDCVIALRVFHHLVPHQEDAFLEAKRVGKNVLLVLPDAYPQNSLNSQPISIEKFIDWNCGKAPTIVESTGHGVVYFWSEQNF